MDSIHSGARIREFRRRTGKTQAALAAEAGISASYLNLIEHNRRRIGGTTLLSLAKALGVRPAELTEEAMGPVVDELRDVAAEAGVSDPASAQALIARFPEWAQTLSSLNRKLRDQARVIAALSDRLSHDPMLAENVHAMLSHITAVRSTADILASVDNIPTLQKRRFHETMVQESEALSRTAQTLANYLGAAADPQASASTPEEAVDHFLRRHNYRFEALDREAEEETPETVRRARLATIIEEMLDSDPPPAAAAPQIRTHLETYADDALALPLHPFAEAARTCGFDPATLAQLFGADLAQVFRRLAVLHRPWIEAPRFALFVVSASGQPLLRLSRPDFALPRHGLACPLWPAFRALSRPGQPIFERVDHDNGTRFAAYAIALPRRSAGFGEEPDLAAHMLLTREAELPSPPPGPPRAIGTTCRTCTRVDCPSRIDPPLLS